MENRGSTWFLVAIWLGSWIAPCWAVEGATAAGPIGGRDIRSAILPPPGLYVGAVGLYNDVVAHLFIVSFAKKLF
jgi:hypothetical protein